MEYSDKTINNTSKSSIITARRKEFRDLDLSLTLHPTKKDIAAVKDLEAVKHSVKNLVLTNFNERPFHPELGGNVRALLFEPLNMFTAMNIQKKNLWLEKLSFI